MVYRIAGNGVSIDGSFIARGGKGWPAYEEWISLGNIPEPEFTMDQLKKNVVKDIEYHANSLVDQAGPSDIRQKNRAMIRAMRLIRKEAKGIITAEELVELESSDGVADLVEQINTFSEQEKGWVNDEARTRGELEQYDTTIKKWPN